MDLFDDDKRLALKPVVTFNTLLAEAFADGECTCIRCKKGGASQEGYAHLHTFEVDGKRVARRFTKTMHAEVKTTLEKAYKAFYKADLPAITEDMLGDLRAMANSGNVYRVKLLLEVSGLLGGTEQDTEVEVDQETGLADELESA